jgi:hypothetical protein
MGDSPDDIRAPTRLRYKVALFNSSDPRGHKIGGIQTYIRDYIHFHPVDMDLLLIGADEGGKMPIGEISEVEFRGRTFKFLPLYRLEKTTADYSKGVTGSDTFFFAKMMLKYFGKLRRILRGEGYTAEIRRVEYAPILFAMGVPFIQMVHVWGAKDQPMSSALAFCCVFGQILFGQRKHDGDVQEEVSPVCQQVRNIDDMGESAFL